MDRPRVPQTKHQVARRARPDAETHDRLYLLKKVGSLRATYQIRALLQRAEQARMRLVLRVPRACTLAPDLAALRRAAQGRLIVERV